MQQCSPRPVKMMELPFNPSSSNAGYFTNKWLLYSSIKSYNWQHSLLLWFIVTFWVPATMTTATQTKPSNLVEEMSMLWLYVLHASDLPSWKKYSTELASCTHVHWRYTLKILYTEYPTPYSQKAFTSREEPLSLWSFVLEINNLKSAKKKKYIKHVVKT